MSLLLFILLLFSSVSRCSQCIDLVCSATDLGIVLIIYDYIKLCLPLVRQAMSPSCSSSYVFLLFFKLCLPLVLQAMSSSYSSSYVSFLFFKLYLSCSCLALYPSGSLSNCCRLIYGLGLPISISRSGKLSAICWRTKASLVQR